MNPQDHITIVDLETHAAWMVKSGQFKGTVEEYLELLRPHYTEEQWKRLTNEEEEVERAE